MKVSVINKLVNPAVELSGVVTAIGGNKNDSVGRLQYTSLTFENTDADFMDKVHADDIVIITTKRSKCLGKVIETSDYGDEKALKVLCYYPMIEKMFCEKEM